MAKDVMHWLKQRLPLERVIRDNFTGYKLPKNFNIWYVFGSLALFVLALQFMSGIFLTMHYTPSAKEAFASIEHIMRDVNYGWLIRYLHTTGASFFFIIIYLHMFRSLLYGSHQKPRELVWVFGMLLYLLLMAEAFMGYLLPWGQMSYWGAQVITSLFAAIPIIGPKLVLMIRGDFIVSDATLHRFFALHIIALPLLLLLLVRLHMSALHYVGANNPEGKMITTPAQVVSFYPYYILKDLWGLAVFLVIFALVVFFGPELGGLFIEPSNYIPANPLQTPTHITPVWYLTPYYAMLRAIPDKLGGIVTMLAAILMLFMVPWLDRSPVRALRYRSWLNKLALVMFGLSVLLLGYLGATELTPMRIFWARLLTGFYFAFFLLMPFYSRFKNNS